MFDLMEEKIFVFKRFKFLLKWVLKKFTKHCVLFLLFE